MLLEVIAMTPDEARTARRAGADRIELVSALSEGGLTPSLGCVLETLEAADGIPVNVMIRPHSRTFVYDEQDLRVMERDIRVLAETGIHAFVLGALTADHRIDTKALRRLLDAAGGKPVTFHRAFDEVLHQEEALETLKGFSSVTTVLTSGGLPSALDAIPKLRKLEALGRERNIAILAGSGLKMESLEAFIRSSGVRQVHFGTGVRQGGALDGNIDPMRIAAIKQIFADMELRGGLAT
ncbi:copper homeostasis protein CutC [Paenibacillus aurantius]|uniref:PF03932 family protein CutC n=1 Tax=Paenibacillus aurantius TaxID=2918900 RepID=A0AA96LJK3_9BACL|nr:copper homeostasis protein CutC [Paenibacillus aurantius]WNQ13276.1 copper homeostasis protein CutC [Paenibacillus aurantius]